MQPKALCFGELLIDFVALERDVTVGNAHRFEKVAGGAPANVAVGLAKLGIPTAFITQLGNDPFGHYLCEVLNQNHVDTSAIVFTNDACTALAFASIEAGGERSFAFYRKPSADMLMTPDALNHTVIKDATIFHFGSITLIDDPVRSTTLAAVKIARQNKAVITYDPNLREPLWTSLEHAHDGILMGFREANIVKMNEEELAFLVRKELSSTDDLVNAARSLWHELLQLIVITRGSDGCIAVTPEYSITVPGYQIVVEDTIGAGDGFMAGLLAGVIHSDHIDFSENSLQSILQKANAVGALTASNRGAIPALPDATTVQAFLQSVMI